MRAILVATIAATLFLLAALASADGLTPRGVMTDLIGHYSKAINNADSTFTCLDGSKTIKLSKVNDEFCDCQDGSDEPGTAACSFDPKHKVPKGFRFQCTNAGYPNVVQTFFHSRVNDGICDCCDGSDEYLYKSVSCPNNCATFAAQKAEDDARREAVRQAGLQARKQLVEKGEKQLQNWRQELITLESSLGDLQKEANELEAQVTVEEEKERAKRKEIHEESLKAKAVWEAEQEEKKKQKEQEQQQQQAASGGDEDAAKKATHADHPPSADSGASSDNHATGGGGEQQLETELNTNIVCVGWKQTKHCDGSSEEREPDMDRDCTVVIESGQSGFCECKSDGADETYPYNCGHRRFRCANVCQFRGSDDAFEDAAADINIPPTPPQEPETFKVDDGSNYFSPEANEARRRRDEARNKMTSAERSIKDLKENLEKDYGPDGVFLGLSTECFEKRAGEFTYKFCPMKSAHQDHTSLGNFKQFATQTYGSWGGKSDYSKQQYEGGTHCWGGPARSCEVILVCGSENVIKSVEEPSMCAYKMVFQTPAICE